MRSASPSRDGMALVIVLGVLVLLTVLVVGFLGRALMERASTSAYFEEGLTDILANQAVNIVSAQIEHASTRNGVAWASQPGMIRTFQPNGDLLNAYKLYSDSDMIAASVDATAAMAALQNWRSSPAHFTDLNEPVILSDPSSGNKTSHFPIIDPSALDKGPGGEPLIQGFEVTGAPDATARQPIPMPARWLYILRDGQAVAPSDASGTTATIPGASRDNPIVGRIAFWTDDETSKLNINTASQGMFWDIPRALFRDERDRMARFQPAIREYQRYPGHPASVSLRPVLGYKTADERSFADFIYEIAPRVQQGGSMGGTAFAGASPVDLDTDRLYASVDELLFSAAEGQREPRTGLDRADIERAKFFLTSRANSPEVNLFNLPRMAIWPINTGAKSPSVLDQTLAFCSTINGKPYYFQRSDAKSATEDMTLDNGRNRKLYDYINALLARPFPGFGSRSFAEKYTTAETEQITTSLFDYIRSSNLYSTALGATAYTGEGAKPLETQGSRAGQVTPLQIGDTKGFGRLPVLSQAVFQLYISGLQSGNGTFPSADFPMQTGKAPAYTDDFSSGSNHSLRALLNATGVGKEVQLLTSGIIYFDAFDPMLGYALPRYNFQIEITFSGDWAVNGQSLGFQNATLNVTNTHSKTYNAKVNNWGGTYQGHYYGGLMGPRWIMQNHTYVRGNPLNKASDNVAIEYPLGSQRVAIHLPLILEQDPGAPTTDGDGNPLETPTLPDSGVIADVANFSGGSVTAKIKVAGQTVQTYTFDFPAFSKPAPIYAPRGYLEFNKNLVPPLPTEADMVLKQFTTSADFKNRWVTQPFNSMKHQGPTANINANTDFCDLWLIQDMDVIVSLEAHYGDKRLLGTRSVLTTGSVGDVDASFIPNKDYFEVTQRIAADFRSEVSRGIDRRDRALATQIRPGRILDFTHGTNALPDIPNRYGHGVQSTTDGGFWPDFDNGTLHNPDDAYINRADEGSVTFTIPDEVAGADTGSRGFPWLSESTGYYDNAIFFSPNKQMPSAGMFGSLPTGGARNKPWQTLLFRPDPGGGSGHPGAQAPEDFLLLDLFWMPVVEPYALSEPFSTNGKVNMNYQIMPFGYIHRSTALRGVFETQEMISIQDTLAFRGNEVKAIGCGTGKDPFANDDHYKRVIYNDTDMKGVIYEGSIRRRLNLSGANGTLKTFEDLFAQNKIFRSETQICSVPLIPEDETWSANFESDYWDSRRLTGDNSREMPYTQLLPRLTTRSNTYTVHYRVQSLKKNPTTDPGVWDESKDRVAAERRGSRAIERYIDPEDARIPDYAADLLATPSLDAFYRWRTLYNRTFAP